MPRRCFSPSPIDSERVVVPGAEAHHLMHVLRVAPGDRLIVFDGSGQEFDAQVHHCRRDAVELAVDAGRSVDRELNFSLTLACGLPKGDRSRWMVEKAVELGVSCVVPLLTERSERPTRDAKASAKLQRYVIEASKQCGRNRLMTIESPVLWSELLAGRPVAAEDAGPNGPTRWVAHPDGIPLPKATRELPNNDVYVAVGPEGGFTSSEIEQASAAGWTVVSLGPRVLRVETAAVALAAALSLGR